ncbi:helix-turn-helix domain containing protein [Acidithiobacillus ferrooxidans]|nr:MULTISPECIES: helix-turn-helix domain containing protein [Acidithiobacillus]MBN6745116.1 helix-turn-helix domain containing protein [Acidithiobacillus sp. MC2.2]MBN6747555.1 helix-turn-helix domain containing protein [Acidithiobacillus sp. PG05]MCR2831716.1 helix-turn-helix domain-containing protein [Acidithiobacillus ferrooxidans]
MRHILYYTYAAEITDMPQPDPKCERLRRLGVLNPDAQRVRAPLFQSGDFFDPQDMVQVKYEMLRHAQNGAASKSVAATLFGLSRPAFYQAESDFRRDGLSGLLPKQRGPKGAHKLTAEVMAFIEARLNADGGIHARTLAQEITTALGLTVHPRSIERAVARKKKR